MSRAELFLANLLYSEAYRGKNAIKLGYGQWELWPEHYDQWRYIKRKREKESKI